MHFKTVSKNTLFALLVLLTISIQALAQKDFRTGYVLLNGDTVRGTIQYREGITATQKCSIQKPGSSEASEYTPLQIGGYGFDTRHFRVIRPHREPQFAEVIVEGHINLLRANETFYLQKDTALVSLTTTTKTIQANGRNYKAEDKNWLVRTKSILLDCSTLNPKLDNVQLSEYPPSKIEMVFKPIVAKYNECKGDKPKTYEVPKKRARVTWGVETAAIFPEAAVIHSSTTLAKSGLSGKSSVGFGGFVNFINPRFSEKLNFRLEAFYSATQFEGHADQGLYSDHYTLDYKTVKVPVGVLYRFGAGNFSPFIHAALSVNLLMNGSEFLVAHQFVPNPVSDKANEAFELNKFNTSFLLGAGVEGKLGEKCLWFVEGRYDSPTDILISYDTESVKMRSMNVLLGVRFRNLTGNKK